MITTRPLDPGVLADASRASAADASRASAADASRASAADASCASATDVSRASSGDASRASATDESRASAADATRASSAPATDWARVARRRHAPAPSWAPRALAAWVAEQVELLEPDGVQWIDGSDAEAVRLTADLVAGGALIALDPERRPGSYLARTDPGDVARVEDRTFICTTDPAGAGPTNNWREAGAMKRELRPWFAGSMRGRTMFVVPFSMGPVGGPLSQLGVQLTDSAYAVLNLRIMARVGSEPLAAFGGAEGEVPFVRGVHSVGHPLRDDDGTTRDDVAWPCNDTKYITQFPETREIWSFGSGYGGNALLAKKCFALRIASTMGRDEGWLAEHMLLIRATSPEGRAFHIAAAFPSACGKTNLAMMQPTLPGWRVETLGDDITWMKPGPDGRLWAMNPETGFFGVAPGTGETSNPVAVRTLHANTIFTNVALTDDGDVWWEGLTDEAPEHLTDWRGDDWTRASSTPAAHPNSRFTAPAEQCPSLSPDWDAFDGVPLDAIVFGGRRATNVPLVTEARSWRHGVFVGATVASEQTAAAEGVVGALRRDPFAMLPFCGYDMGDYFAHWLRLGAALGDRAPQVFQVNWFRKGADGSFLWPGFGENSRVIAWIAGRLAGTADAVETPLGLAPAPGALDLDGLDLTEEALAESFAVPTDAWLAECDLTDEFFDRFGSTLPTALRDELAALRPARGRRRRCRCRADRGCGRADRGCGRHAGRLTAPTTPAARDQRVTGPGLRVVGTRGPFTRHRTAFRASHPD